MPFKFNSNKTTQAIAFLLHQSSTKSANYMRLIKLLYIADRESLKDTGRPITGDRVFAMDRGPVLSNLLDLIKGSYYDCSQWDKFIRKENYHIRLIDSPGNGELCRYEIEKLQEIWDRYDSKDEWDMVNETHEFPEWKKNHMTAASHRIPLSDILEAVGRPEKLEDITKDVQQSENFTNFFQG
jgi:uncharacterized phage-associated protein